MGQEEDLTCVVKSVEVFHRRVAPARIWKSPSRLLFCAHIPDASSPIRLASFSKPMPARRHRHYRFGPFCCHLNFSPSVIRHNHRTFTSPLSTPNNTAIVVVTSLFIFLYSFQRGRKADGAKQERAAR